MRKRKLKVNKIKKVKCLLPGAACSLCPDDQRFAYYRPARSRQKAQQLEQAVGTWRKVVLVAD